MVRKGSRVQIPKAAPEKVEMEKKSKKLDTNIKTLFALWMYSLIIGLVLFSATFLISFHPLFEISTLYFLLSIYIIYPIGVFLNILTIIDYYKLEKPYRKPYSKKLLITSLLFHSNVVIAFFLFYIALNLIFFEIAPTV